MTETMPDNDQDKSEPDPTDREPTDPSNGDEPAAPGLLEDLRYGPDGTKSGKVPYLATAPEGQGIDRM